jgi:hypothetical protein
MTLTQDEREIARGTRRRFVNDELTPAELAVEIERWEQHRALLAGDLEAQDFNENDAQTLNNGIAYADLRLQELQRQAKRFIRAAIPNRSSEGLDFARARYVDLVGMVEMLTAQQGKKQSNGAYLFRCPFHDGDREPSLRIYPPGRGWNCFGCGRGGRDAASFAAEFFHSSQADGLRWVLVHCDVF